MLTGLFQIKEKSFLPYIDNITFPGSFFSQNLGKPMSWLFTQKEYAWGIKYCGAKTTGYPCGES